MALDLTGKVHASSGWFELDLDLKSDKLTWEGLARLLKRDGEGKIQKKGHHLYNWPLNGKITLTTDTFEYKELTWQPLHAEILFSAESVDIKISEARLCGISTPGRIRFSPKALNIHFMPESKGKPLQDMIGCLSGQREAVTGVYGLTCEIKGQDTPENIVPSLGGYVHFTSNNGRINKSIAASKILSLLNLTEIYRGQFPELKKEGLAYKKILLKGKINGGKVVVDEAVLDAQTMHVVGKGIFDLDEGVLDATAIVAPLKTVDRFMKKIPIARRIMGDKVFSMAVKISGPLYNPRVTVLPASAVQEGIVGMMKRTLKLPVDLIMPVFPNKDASKTKE